MDWTKIKLRLSLEIDHVLLYFRKYWKLTFFNPSTLGIWTVFYFLSGIFIQSTSNLIDYLKIVIIGTFLMQPYWDAFLGINYTVLTYNILSYYFLFSSPLYLLLFSKFIGDMISLLTFSFFNGLVLYFLDPKLVWVVPKIVLFIPIVLLVIYSVSMLVAPIVYYFRSEGSYVIWIFNPLFISFIPGMYSLSKFSFYPYLVIYPPAIFIEELRKYILGQGINLKLLTIAGIIAIVYYIIGYVMLKKVFNIMRKKGLVGLR